MPRIINCVTQLPFKIQLNEFTNDWKLTSQNGNSALYSSLNFLNNKKYNDMAQIIVGWTGEITREDILLANIQKQNNELIGNNNNNSQKIKDIETELENTTINSSSSILNDVTHESDSEEDEDINNNMANDNSDETFYLTPAQMQNLNDKLNSSSSKSTKSKNKNAHYEPIWLLRKDQDRWRHYAEKIIWPTLHYILNPFDIESNGNISSSSSSEKDNWWYDYVKFNEAYAMKIGEIYQPGDIIWIHDYYLMLLPQLLRMKFNNITFDNPNDTELAQNTLIGYFHHAPWPSYEYFRCLSKRKQILDGLVGANQICFQNEQFSRHFVSSCKRLLDSTAKNFKNPITNFDEYQISAYGGDVVVNALPIGVDKDQLLKDAFADDIDSKVETIKEAYKGKKIIIGRDRLDSVRGVVQKLRAFETFLEMYPEWRENVVLIQVSSPTTNRDSPQTIRLEQQVNDLVNSINSTYGNLNFAPVLHYYMRIPKDVYLSLLRAADLCVITSVRDGMNTTALEYVTIKSNESADDCFGSPLILSEFSGSSTLLKDAIIINPWDSVAVAKSINMSLNMTQQQKNDLQKKLSPEVPSIQKWTTTFLDSLLKSNVNSGTKNKITPALNRPVLLDNYNKAKRRLFLFDYDGTLTPIVQDPAAAIPTAKLYTILDKLSADPKNQIWIISGRDQEFLNQWMGSKNKNLGLSAEHGCFIKDVGMSEWINLAEQVDMSWQDRVAKVMEHFTNKTPGSFIEKKAVAYTWHYRRTVPELGEYNAAELKKQLLAFSDEYDFDVMDGKANIEVRPRFVNKGEIVKRLVWHKHGQLQDLSKPVKKDGMKIEEMPDFILCLGDDFTDEDMFRQLNSIEADWSKLYPNKKNDWSHYGIYPVTVGSASKQTVAKAHLTDPGQVLDTLGLLVGKISLFQSPGTVELDSRGHVKNSESSMKAKIATEKYVLKRTASNTNVTK